MKQNGWIAFLENRGSIKKRKDELIYDDKKVYIAEFEDGDIYKIGEHNSSKEFSLIFLGERNGVSSSRKHMGDAQHPLSFKDLISAFSNLAGGKDVKQFTSLLVAMKFYNIDGMGD